MLSAAVAGLNLVSLVLLLMGWKAIRRDQRDRHRTLMLVNLGVAVLFLMLYAAQVILMGHKRFPGDDWVRTVFLVILGTHTVAAVALLPLVPVTLYRALTERFESHARIARITIVIWFYVSITGVVVYGFVNHLRPGV
ncbi:MAG: DUF420 domain-containing protein [bacterium]|nr:DUF420 domain-containing protein [bacterium]